MSWQWFYEKCVTEERKRWHKGPSLKDRAWFIGPFMVTTIFGRKGEDPYKTDVQLGRLALHIFWRGDVDPDPHDHQHAFWTFPFVGYREEVLDLTTCKKHENVVAAFRLHHRKAEYVHRLTGREDGRGMMLPLATETFRQPVVTLVWRGKKRREWGFWVHGPVDYGYEYVPWREYIGRPT